MILIVDGSGRGRGAKLRSALLSHNIPCAAVNTLNIAKYPAALIVFAFVSSEDMLNTISVRCGRTPLLAVNETGGRIYNSDVRFYNPDIHKTIEEFIISFLYERYGITAGHYSRGDVSVLRGTVMAGVSYLNLTKTETRILVLFLMCSDKWISADNIGRACFESSGGNKSVAVHICNINRKTKTVLGKPIIICSRRTGYRLNGAV